MAVKKKKRGWYIVNISLPNTAIRKREKSILYRITVVNDIKKIINQLFGGKQKRKGILYNYSIIYKSSKYNYIEVNYI